jgi:very-short-patch-repair endonuclease
LVIELDGGQHLAAREKVYDEARTGWLEQRGYRVLRFWNIDILKDSEVGAILLERIKATGIPLPEPLRGSTLPQGEGTS